VTAIPRRCTVSTVFVTLFERFSESGALSLDPNAGGLPGAEPCRIS